MVKDNNVRQILLIVIYTSLKIIVTVEEDLLRMADENRLCKLNDLRFGN